MAGTVDDDNHGRAARTIDAPGTRGLERAMTALADEVRELLQATVERFVAPNGVITRIERLAIGAGLSGDIPERFQIAVRIDDTPGSELTTRLVVKNASLIERKTLAHLQAQLQAQGPDTCRSITRAISSRTGPARSACGIWAI